MDLSLFPFGVARAGLLSPSFDYAQSGALPVLRAFAHPGTAVSAVDRTALESSLALRSSGCFGSLLLLSGAVRLGVPFSVYASASFGFSLLPHSFA